MLRRSVRLAPLLLSLLDGRARSVSRVTRSPRGAPSDTCSTARSLAGSLA